MGVKTDIDLLRARFEAQWAILAPDVPYILDNDPSYRPDPNATWARLSIKPDQVRTASFSERRVDQTGIAYIQIFVPKGTGILELSALGDEAIGIFRLWKSPDSTLRCTWLRTNLTQATDDEPFHMFLVAASYESSRIV